MELAGQAISSGTRSMAWFNINDVKHPRSIANVQRY
jgi:hypothetical protein